MSEVVRLTTVVEGLRSDVSELCKDVQALTDGLHALADAIAVANGKLDVIHEEMQAEPGPSPVADLLQKIVKLLTEQGQKLDEIHSAQVGPVNGAGPR